jgi:hypothetical protein
VTTDYSEVLPVQKLTDGFGKHTEPMLGMRCSRQFAAPKISFEIAMISSFATG